MKDKKNNILLASKRLNRYYLNTKTNMVSCCDSIDDMCYAFMKFNTRKEAQEWINKKT